MPRSKSTKSKNKGQVSSDIAMAENQPQLDIASVLPLLTVSQEIPPRMDNMTEDQLQLDVTTVSPLRELPDMQKMDHSIDTTTIEDFDIRPSKKAKSSESSVLDDQFPSPTISTSSMLSECFESIGSKTDNQRNGDQLPSLLSPTMLMVSPVSELINDEETVSAGDHKQKVADDNNKPDEPPISILMNDEEKYLPGDDKQKVSADDDKKLDEPKYKNNDVIYDYLPQGIFFTN